MFTVFIYHHYSCLHVFFFCSSLEDGSVMVCILKSVEDVDKMVEEQASLPTLSLVNIKYCLYDIPFQTQTQMYMEV